MIFRIKLADQIVEIRSIYRNIYFYCYEYVIDFKKDEEPNIIIQIKQEDIEREITEQKKRTIQNETADASYIPGYMEALAAYRLIAAALLHNDTILFHGSVVSTNGCGYIFTGPSGVGKSTRSELWIKAIPDSFIVNGDKPLLRITNDTVYAYGTPWCGKEKRNRNTKVSIKAIFVVERVNNQEDSYIRSLSCDESFIELYKQTYIPLDYASTHIILQLVKKIAEDVRIFRFRSLPTVDAIRLAHETALGIKDR